MSGEYGMGNRVRMCGKREMVGDKEDKGAFYEGCCRAPTFDDYLSTSNCVFHLRCACRHIRLEIDILEEKDGS